jgi:peptidoglycan/LPS O-acetylase OafA/YrhL
MVIEPARAPDRSAAGTQATAAWQAKGLHIPSLDGLRAVSFLFVFVAHSGADKLVPGGFGVTVFFFLSGFLITTLLRIEDRKTGTVSLRGFYLRRVFRILPPFYITLLSAIGLGLIGLVPGQLEPRPIAALLLHFGNFWFASHGSDGVPAGTPVYWSLAVEEHFYFGFPLLYLLTRRMGLKGGRQGLLFLAIAALVLSWRVLLVFRLGVPADRTYLCTDTRLDSILFGCTLAVAANPVLDPIPGGATAWKRWLLPAGTALLLFTFLFRAPWFRESFRYTLQGLGLVPLFISAMLFPDWGPFRVLNRPSIAFVGVLSYSLYLVHHVVLYTVRAHLPGLNPFLQAGVALAISLTYASAMYRYVEKPFARLRKRFSVA